MVSRETFSIFARGFENLRAKLVFRMLTSKVTKCPFGGTDKVCLCLWLVRFSQAKQIPRIVVVVILFSA